MFVSRPRIREHVGELNSLVGLVGLWAGNPDWDKGSDSLFTFFPGFLFRATRTWGPKELSSSPTFVVVFS